jgi:hypothetical protein
MWKSEDCSEGDVLSEKRRNKNNVSKLAVEEGVERETGEYF